MLLGSELGLLAFLTAIVLISLIVLIMNDDGGWADIDNVFIRLIGYQAIFILASICLSGGTVYALTAGLIGLGFGLISALRTLFRD